MASENSNLKSGGDASADGGGPVGERPSDLNAGPGGPDLGGASFGQLGAPLTGASASQYQGEDAGTTVATDLDDYAPGSTAYITMTGIEAGSTVRFEVDHVNDPGADGEWGTFDDVTYQLGGEGHDAWYVTDGGAGDLDGLANGIIETTWYVNPDDSLDERFVLTGRVVEAGGDGTFGTADDVATGAAASATFTDSLPGDHDADGVLDVDDIDDDNDGITDTAERTLTYSSTSTTGGFSYAQNLDGSTGGNADKLISNLGSGGNDDPLKLIDGDIASQVKIGKDVIVEYDIGQLVYAGTSLTLLEGGGGNDGNVEVYVSYDSTGGANAYATTQGASTLVYSGASDQTVTFTAPLSFRYIQIVSIGGTAGWEEFDFTTLTQTFDIDSDGDGIFDHQDIDKDNDGITDNVEAQATSAYVAPSGTGAGITDVNGDGMDDNYAAAYGFAGITEVDTDADGIVDTRDADSDGDGTLDVAERGDAGPTTTPAGPFNDADGDGLLDEFEGADANDDFDVNDENVAGDVAGDGTYSNITLSDQDNDTDANEAVASRTTNDASPLTYDLDYRDALPDVDTDGDGVLDSLDVDDDNDGITDVDEQTIVLRPLTETGAYGYAQNWSGDTAQHYVPPGSGGDDDPMNLLDGDLTTDLRMHDEDIFEFDFGVTLPAGTIIVLEEGQSQNDTPIAIYVSTDSSDPRGDKLSTLGTGQGEGWDNAIPGTLSTQIEAFLWDSGTNDFIRDANGDPINYTDLDPNSVFFGYVPSDVTVAFALPHEARFVQFLGTPDGTKHGGWAEMQLANTATDPNADPDAAVQFISNLDSDGDGTPDHLDIDKDNDGITDNVEAQTTAGYVAPSGTGAGMTDVNGDGLDDIYDPGLTGDGLDEIDSDGDGIIDTLDRDSDGDGTDDVAQRGDGGPTSTPTGTLNDADGDGLLDEFEGTLTNDGYDVNDENIVGDTAGDGTYSHFNIGDVDEDTNANEADPARSTNDAVPVISDLDYRDARSDLDTDGDGIADSTDLDDDNDGIVDSVEKSFTYSALSATASVSYAQALDGSTTTVNSAASLIDGNTSTELSIPDFTIIEYDLGQTLFAGTQIEFVEGAGGGDDYVEIYVSNGTTNLAPSGYANTTTLLYAGPSDATQTFTLSEDITHVQIVGRGGASGFEEMRLTSLTQELTDGLDSDGDGLADHVDLDKDNDGITDNVEAQTTSGYIAPSGTGAGITDVNNDGLDDNYAPSGLVEVDTDGDGIADTFDSDSDNDGTLDVAERGDGGPTSTPVGPFNDADGDGLLDEFEGAASNDGFDANDDNYDGGVFLLADSDGDASPDGSTAAPLGADLDYRDDRTDNAPPVAVDDITVGFQGRPLEDYNVLANDSDPNGNALDVIDAVLSDPNAGAVVINADDTITFTPDPSFVGPAQVTYTVSDGLGGSDTATLTINVIPNAPPVIQEPVSFQVDENQSLAANLQATDPEGDALTWSIVGGPDAAHFTVDPDTGQLSFLTVPDFEAPLDEGGDNQYNLTVQVADAFGSRSQAILVSVEDVDDNPNLPPVFTTPLSPPGFPAVIVLTGRSGEMDAQTGNPAPVGTVGATDPDPDTLVYTLFGEDENLFVINAATGAISFADPIVTGSTVGKSFDGDRIYELDVLVTDGNGGSDVMDLDLPLFLGG